MWDLKSGDAAIEGSREYADYRDELIGEEKVAAMSLAYQEQVGILTDAKEFVAESRRWLSQIAQETDRSFPENDAIRIEHGEPVLAKVPRKKTPARLAWFEATIRKEMPQTPILDALADTENLLNWTRSFGPLSGLDTKLENPTERYVLASFCYGCNLGPSQTARSVQGTDRRQIAWINQRHITEDALDEAITTVTSITTSLCRDSGDRASTPPPMAPDGISMNKTFFPSTTSAMAATEALATTMSPTPTSPSSATSSRAVSGRRSTSSTVCSRTRATSSPTFFMRIPKDNRSLSLRLLICSALS
jgi:hypothetical protein